MTGQLDLHVQIGEVKVGSDGQFLHALLGSCIGVGFIWPQRRLCGLAHCLLSRSPQLTDEIGARHVDQAVKSLTSLMDIRADDLRRIQVFLAGGGNMTLADDTPDNRLVGSINASFARKYVKQSGFRLFHEDLGGNNARKVVIDCMTGEFNIKKIARLGADQCLSM